MVYEGFVEMMGWYSPGAESALCHGCYNLVSTDSEQWLVDVPTQGLGGVLSVERQCKQSLVEWLDGPRLRSDSTSHFRVGITPLGKMVQEWCDQSWESNGLFGAGWCPMCLAQVMHENWIACGLTSDDKAFKQLDSKVTQWLKDHRDQINSNQFETPHNKDSLWLMTRGWRRETRWMRPGPRCWSAHTTLTDGVN